MKKIIYSADLQKELLNIILENPNYKKDSIVEHSAQILENNHKGVNKQDILANIDLLIDESLVVEIYNEPTYQIDGLIRDKEFFSLRIHSTGVKLLQPDNVLQINKES